MDVSIGRRIYFYPSQDVREDMGQEDLESPFDAGVIFVRNQSSDAEGIVEPARVNLSVTSHHGVIETFLNVPLIEGRDPTEEERASGYATWMPFQIQKAQEAEPAANGG